MRDELAAFQTPLLRGFAVNDNVNVNFYIPMLSLSVGYLDFLRFRT
jgi:hypothetical protein